MSKKAYSYNIERYFKSLTTNSSSVEENQNNQKPNSPPSKRQKLEPSDVPVKENIDKQMSVATICGDIGSSWLPVLEPEFKKEYLAKLIDYISTERLRSTVYPPPELVFSWTHLCALKQIKVIILGQDPYHNKNQAHGLSFSVPFGVRAPPSLVNMYKELETDIEGFERPPHGNLESWAKQGVLLLNSCLTVKANTPNSHKDKGWEQLTDTVIKWLNENGSQLVFLLWGAYAQKKGSIINKNKHLVLTAPHPSPFSANKGFYGCKHFSKTNEYLKLQEKKEINWKDL